MMHQMEFSDKIHAEAKNQKPKLRQDAGDGATTEEGVETVDEVVAYTTQFAYGVLAGMSFGGDTTC